MKEVNYSNYKFVQRDPEKMDDNNVYCLTSIFNGGSLIKEMYILSDPGTKNLDDWLEIANVNDVLRFIYAMPENARVIIRKNGSFGQMLYELPPVQIAYYFEEGGVYIAVWQTEDGWAYIIANDWYERADEGIYDNNDMSIYDVVDQLISEFNPDMNRNNKEEVDFDELLSEVNRKMPKKTEEPDEHTCKGDLPETNLDRFKRMVSETDDPYEIAKLICGAAGTNNDIHVLAWLKEEPKYFWKLSNGDGYLGIKTGSDQLVIGSPDGDASICKRFTKKEYEQLSQAYKFQSDTFTAITMPKKK